MPNEIIQSPELITVVAALVLLGGAVLISGVVIMMTSWVSRWEDRPRLKADQRGRDLAALQKRVEVLEREVADVSPQSERLAFLEQLLTERASLRASDAMTEEPDA